MKKLGNIFLFISIGAMFLMPSNIVKADSAVSVTSEAGISFHGENPENTNLSDNSIYNSQSETESLPSLNGETDSNLVLLGMGIIFLIQYIRLSQGTNEARENKIRDNSLL